LYSPGFTGVMLHHVFHPELIVQIFTSILLQRLERAHNEFRTTDPFKNHSHLHMMKNRLSKRKKVRMVGIKDIKKAPAIAASEFSADELC
jgi:hypothetical protein